MERVEKFLKEADTYYLATMEGDQPRVRPFGTIHIFDGKLISRRVRKKRCLSSYISTRKQRSVHSKMGNGYVYLGNL